MSYQTYYKKKKKTESPMLRFRATLQGFPQRKTISSGL